jgi:hypothetical protein
MKGVPGEQAPRLSFLVYYSLAVVAILDALHMLDD